MNGENHSMETQTIYIGPNIPSLGLLKNQVYLGGIPGQVRAALADNPAIEELIVPLEDFDESELKSRTKGEHLHHVCEELKRKAGVKK